MVSLSTSKGTDNCVQAQAVRWDYPNSGPPYYVSLPPKTYPLATAAKVVGTKKESLFNRTRNYKPGSGLTNPIIHYENSASCTSEDASLYVVYELANKAFKPVLMRRIVGQLAAFAQQNFSTSFVMGRMPDSSDLDVLARAVSKTREVSFEFATTIGELPETLSMLKMPLTKLADIGTEVNKMTKGPVRGYASRLTNAWLLVMYGVLPLLNEVDDIRTAINAKLGADFGPLLKKRAKRIIDPSIDGTKFSRNIGPCWLHGYEETETKTSVRATVYYQSQRSAIDDLGLGVNSLIPTLWALTPYSFVFDWFIDVGGWLNTAIPNPSVRDLGNCMSVTSESTYTLSLNHASLTQVGSVNYPYSSACSIYKQSRRCYQRNIGLSLPALPQVNRRVLNISQEISLAALALQRAFNAWPKPR